MVAAVYSGITPNEDLIDNTLPGEDMISIPWIANDSCNQFIYSDVKHLTMMLPIQEITTTNGDIVQAFIVDGIALM
jgi:hypothetical protein